MISKPSFMKTVLRVVVNIFVALFASILFGGLLKAYDPFGIKKTYDIFASKNIIATIIFFEVAYFVSNFLLFKKKPNLRGLKFIVFITINLLLSILVLEVLPK